ncbi:MAG: inositol monophosphatase [Acidobacteriota bacterium]
MNDHRTPLWEREAEAALRAVSIAGELALERPEALGVRAKESARDIVTDMDLRIESVLREQLAPLGHPVVAEESFVMDTDSLPEDRPAFVVDPIDGTANYASGLSLYAVSVGLISAGCLVTGAVAIPAHKELFFTHGDAGAYLNGRALKPPAPCTLSQALVAATFSGRASSRDIRTGEFRLFGQINDASRGCLRLGSAAVNICYVAAGRMQAAYGFDAKLWDVAGALAVARQAGCAVFVERAPGSVVLDYAVGVAGVVTEIQSFMSEVR